MGEEGQPLENPLSPNSDSVPVLFHTEPGPEPSFLTSGSIKWPEPFVQGSLHSEMDPSVCADQPDTGVPFHGGKQNRGSQHFFLF